jgi:hypothetical protein
MRSAALVALVVPLLLAGSLVTTAAADPPPTLYVSQFSGIGTCDDSGPGTLALPLCSLQEAADVVVPGQTVIVGPHGGHFPGDVRITRSGTPGLPITFEAGLPWGPAGPQVTVGGLVNGPPSANGFTLSGVHDVKIQGFQVDNTSSAGIVVSNSGDITIDHVAEGRIVPLPTDNIDLRGTNHDITISRSSLRSDTTDISVGPGTSGLTVAENEFANVGTTTSLSITGASSTAITNNTSFIAQCPVAVFSISGSTGTVIENNLVSAQCTSTPLVFVAADSTATTTLDYNVVATANPDPLYSWGGTTYATPTALNAATGQAAHDLDVNPLLNAAKFEPNENSPLVDSANDAAPGVLATDFNGRPREDDPLVANAGTSIVDRGAVERQDPMTIDLRLSAIQAPVGGTVTATLTATPGWAPITGYTVDFADGTPPVHPTATTFPHVFPTASPFTNVTATVSDALGFTSVPTSQGITVVPPAPLVPRITANVVGPLHVSADASGSTDSWNITTQSCDFGDGTPPFTQAWGGRCERDYTTAGLHRVTVTLADAGGNTSTTSTVLRLAGPGQRQLPGATHLAPTGQCGVCRTATTIHTAVTATRAAVTHIAVVTQRPAVAAPAWRWCVPLVRCQAAN